MQQTIGNRWLEQGLHYGEEQVIVRLIIKIGVKRLGEPPVGIREALSRITEIDRLACLHDRIQEVASWREFLEDDIAKSNIKVPSTPIHVDIWKMEPAGLLAGIIFLIGIMRLGRPPSVVSAKLNSITDLDRLERLLMSIFEVASWDQLFSE